MSSKIERQYLLGITAGKILDKNSIDCSLRQHRRWFKSAIAQQVCAEAITDFESGNEVQLNDAYRRLYAHTFLVPEEDREGIAFLSGLMKGWAAQQGIKVCLAA